MTDLLAQLSPGGWALLIGAAVLAGIVRGFTGFGTAMVYLPLAGQVLAPFPLLTTLVIMDIFGPLPNVPRALREADRADILRLGLGLVLAMPLGVLVLSAISGEVFRYAVSILALILLVLLVSGFRYRGAMSPPLVTGTGALGGFLAGTSGLPGPPVILLYMASPLPVATIRANLLLYLLLADAVMLAVFWLGAKLVVGAILIGLIVMPVYMAGNVLGARIFDPDRAAVYRGAAYAIIAGSALLGLPLWD